MPNPSDPYNTNPTAAAGLAPENAPTFGDIDDLAAPTEGAGAWPKGWYRATIIDGYSTGKGTVMETRDGLSNNGTSRNMHVCFAVDGNIFVPSDSDPAKRKLTKGPGGVRNIRETYNYSPADSSPERLAAIRRAREGYKAKQGAWGEKGTEAHSLQSSSLSVGRISQLQKAVGFKLPFEANRFDVRPLIKQSVDVRLTIDEKGFSEVAAVAKSGEHVK